MPALTLDALNRATLARQSLLERAPVDAATGMRRAFALQAQEAASPYLALWNRVVDFDPAELDAAYARREIVKASLMRVTLHAAHADDHRLIYAALRRTPLRESRLGDARFRQFGLTADEADALMDHIVEFATTPRTNAEFDAFFEARLGALPAPGMWWALRTYAPVVHAPTGGPWSFGPRPSFVTSGVPHDLDEQEALQALAKRYLEAFGPASVADFARFATLRRASARAVLQASSDMLVTLTGPDGAELWDVPGGELPDERTPAPPRLMAMWDSVLLAHDDRTRIVSPDYRRLVIRTNGDTLPTVLVDGRVAGVWRAVPDGVEVSAFHPLPKAVWHSLDAEAAALVALLADRDPLVYSRFGHWWRSMPADERRVLGR